MDWVYSDSLRAYNNNRERVRNKSITQVAFRPKAERTGGIMTTAKTTTKKFNARNATRADFDRELKRIASHKCLTGKALKVEEDEAKRAELQAKYDAILAEYDKVKKAKAKKFPGRKTYMDFTKDEIAALNLEQTMAGIASLACKRSRYPHLAGEVRKVENLFQAHKAELQGKAAAREALKNMSKEELEALLAEAK